MTHADNIEKKLEKLNFKSTAAMREKILSEASQAMEQTINASANKPSIGRIIMRSNITKFAAAIIIIAALTIIYQLTGSIDGSGVAWAGVAGKVEDAQNFVYRIRQTETTGPNENGFEFSAETEMISYNSFLYGNKTESYRNGELTTRSFSLLQTKEFIGICPPAKMYELHSLSDAAVDEMNQMSPRKIVSRFMSANYRSLGSDILNGTKVEGVEVDDPRVLRESPPPLESFVARLWVSIETELPVWLELEYIPKGSTATTTIVVDKFIWNMEFNESDFIPEIPADYTPEKKSIPASVEQKHLSLKTAEQTERYLSKFKSLGLPDIGNLELLGLDNEPQADITLAGHIEIWKTQDDFIRNWPNYSDVRTKLHEELKEKLDIDNLTTKELIATGLALRQRFWQNGGCLSTVSYPFAYASRILLEEAHDKDPENMDITDELVESILSVELIWEYTEDSDGKIRNPCYNDILKTLRLTQYEQIRKDTEQGYVPVWKDFVRINDLAILLGSQKDYDKGLEIVDWLISTADQGGWNAYLSPLRKMQKKYHDRESFFYNIYIPKTDAFPEEYRYVRRLPSFQGPIPNERRLKPAHILNSNPTWTGN